MFSLSKRFRVDGRKRFEYATCGRVFFSKTVEEVSVVKNIRIRVDKAAFEWEPIGPIGFRHRVESLNYTLDKQISLNEIRAN